MALLYAKRGSELVLVARRKELLEKLVQECMVYTPKISFYVADVTIESQILDLSKFCKEFLGKVDLLIISSGILSVSTFEKLCADDSLRQQSLKMYETNVLGPMFCCKHFLELLKVCKGKLCVISSLAGHFGAPTRSLYSCTKFALNGFMESLRIEWKHFGISIILISPSTVDTEFRKSAIDSTDSKKSKSSLSPREVALKISRANDSRVRHLFIPSYFWIIYILRNFLPSIIDYYAGRKYGF